MPAAPEPDKSRLFLIAALPLGLFAGIAAAVLARVRDGRIYIPRDLEQALGFAPIAILPARGEVSAGVLDEYLLRLAAGIENAYRTASARVFVVTAVDGGSDTRWLLQGVAEKLRALRLDVGVVSTRELLALRDGSAEEQAVRPEALERRVATEQGKGIASAKLDGLRVRHHVVLVDAEPLLHSAASEYVARCADATILVVSSGVTRTDELTSATALLSRLRVRGVGAVLAEIRLEHAGAAFKQAIRDLEVRTSEASRTAPAGAQKERASAKTSAPVAHDVATAETFSEAAVDDAPVVERVNRSTKNEQRVHQAGAAGVQDEAPAVFAREHPGEKAQEELPLDLAETDAGDIWGSTQDQKVYDRRTEFRGFDQQRPAAPQAVYDEPALAVDSHAAPATLNARYGAVAAVSSPADPPVEADLAPVGRLVEEDDRVVEVPSHTRSKIRIAFKEQEVSSKTTWFSKLFRGDPPASFRVIPDGGQENNEESEPAEEHRAAERWQGAPAEVGPIAADESALAEDPEFEHLLSRIGARAEATERPALRDEPEGIHPVARSTAADQEVLSMPQPQLVDREAPTSPDNTPAAATVAEKLAVIRERYSPRPHAVPEEPVSVSEAEKPVELFEPEPSKPESFQAERLMPEPFEAERIKSETFEAESFEADSSGTQIFEPVLLQPKLVEMRADPEEESQVLESEPFAWVRDVPTPETEKPFIVAALPVEHPLPIAQVIEVPEAVEVAVSPERPSLVEFVHAERQDAPSGQRVPASFAAVGTDEASSVEVAAVRNAVSAVPSVDQPETEDRPTGLSRRWALLSRYEERLVTTPASGVPEPAHRVGGGTAHPGKQA